MVKLSKFLDMIVVLQKETGITITSLEIDGAGDKQVGEEFDFDEIKGIKCFGYIKTVYDTGNKSVPSSLSKQEDAIKEALKNIGIRDDFTMLLRKSETAEGIGLYKVTAEFSLNFYIERETLKQYYKNYEESLEKSDKEEVDKE